MAAMEEEAQLPHGDDPTTCAQGEGGLPENCTDSAKNYPLHQACIDGSLDLVKDLVRNGADLNACSAFDQGQDQEMDSIRRGMSAVYGIVPEEWDWPLFRAVWHGHSDVVKLLAESGAHYVKKCPVPYVSPMNECFEHSRVKSFLPGSLLEAAVSRCSSVVNFLFDFYRSDITFDDAMTSFAAAVKYGDVRKMRKAVGNKNISQMLQCKDDSEKTHRLIRVLFKRSQPQDDSLCAQALDRFGDMLLTDAAGCKRTVTLLKIAISRGLFTTAERLIQLVSAKHLIQGWLVFLNNFSMEAICLGSIANLLPESDVFFELNEAGSIALSSGNLPILRSMADTGLFQPSHHRREVLNRCIGCSRYGADVYETLSWAVSTWDLDFRGGCRLGQEALYRCVKRGTSHIQALDALLRLGIDANTGHRIGSSAPLSTPAHKHLEHCMLLSHPSTDRRDPSVEVLEMLIRHGADLALRNRDGYTALSHLFWLAQLLVGQQELQAAVNPRFQRCIWLGGVVFSAEGSSRYAQSDEPWEWDWDAERHADAEEDPLPKLLRPENPMRPFLERLAGKFGLGLLSMGADTLFGPQHWPRMESYLERAGIPWEHVPSLQTSCWTVIRRSIGSRDFQGSVNQLPLVERIKEFLMTV